MSEFDRLADERWDRGVREIRGGDARKPFDGDPVAEGMEEALDLRNYANEAERQGLLGQIDAGLVRSYAAAAFAILKKETRCPTSS